MFKFIATALYSFLNPRVKVGQGYMSPAHPIWGESVEELERGVVGQAISRGNILM